MKIVFAILAIFWWIAIWGLSDLLTESWTREQKFRLYVGILIVIAMIVYVFPDMLDRL
jgi:hypothetical protein